MLTFNTSAAGKTYVPHTFDYWRDVLDVVILEAQPINAYLTAAAGTVLPVNGLSVVAVMDNVSSLLAQQLKNAVGGCSVDM